MHRGGRRVLLSVGLALVALGATASLARADDSQIRISEVYSDASAGHGDFIELQLLADGQAVPPGGTPSGSGILLCGATTCPVQIASPASPTLAAANSQRTILIGWFDNPNVDFTVPSNFNIPALTGAVCYYHSFTPPLPVDCVRWGNSTAPVPSVGTNAMAMDGVNSLTRSEARGCPTLMEAIDDSDNSSADFSLATPTPRNNFQTPTETPCASPTPLPPTTPKKKCKKKKKHHASAVVAKKKCKKHKK